MAILRATLYYSIEIASCICFSFDLVSCMYPVLVMTQEMFERKYLNWRVIWHVYIAC